MILLILNCLLLFKQIIWNNHEKVIDGSERNDFLVSVNGMDFEINEP